MCRLSGLLLLLFVVSILVHLLTGLHLICLWPLATAQYPGARRLEGFTRIQFSSLATGLMLRALGKTATIRLTHLETPDLDEQGPRTCTTRIQPRLQDTFRTKTA